MHNDVEADIKEQLFSLLLGLKTVMFCLPALHCRDCLPLHRPVTVLSVFIFSGTF